MQALQQLRDHYALIAAAYGAVGGGRFFTAPDDPPRIEWRRVRALCEGAAYDGRWASDYEPVLPEARVELGRYKPNATVHVRFFEHRRPSPTVICVHGYCGGNFHFEERLWRANVLYQRGLNVILFTLPFHALRCPWHSLLPLFPCHANLLRTNDGFGQAIWDLRRLLDWLGGLEVGVAGMSLGGYTTALLTTIEPRLAFAIPIIPLADLTDAMLLHEAMRGIAIPTEIETLLRRALAIHSPLCRGPLLDGKRVLVVAAEHDHITGAVHAERLASHLHASLVRCAGSHLLSLWRTSAPQLIEAFVARQLLQPLACKASS